MASRCGASIFIAKNAEKGTRRMLADISQPLIVPEQCDEAGMIASEGGSGHE
jgi:hypothetical protein